jgi:lipoate-protein ligase B
LISVLQLGTVDYATGLRLQEQLVALRKENKIGDVLLLLEHTPVITLGRNAKAANVVASRELLAQHGVELYECDRGGDVTFHGPGQIVGYPIFDLRGFRVGADALVRPAESQTRPSQLRKTLGVVEFVRRLEEVLMRTCADFAITTKRIAGLTGVWTDPADTAKADSKNAHAGTAALSRPAARSVTAASERSDLNLLSSRANSTPLSFRETSQILSSRAGESDSMNRSLQSRDGGFASGHPDSNREGHDSSRATIGIGRGAALAAGVRSSHSAEPFPESKLAAIGVHVSRFVTSHGFALNVNADLSYFDLIIPCGITSKPVTSMQQQLGHALDLNAVSESIFRNFGAVFQSQILRVDALDALVGHIATSP